MRLPKVLAVVVVAVLVTGSAGVLLVHPDGSARGPLALAATAGVGSGGAPVGSSLPLLRGRSASNHTSAAARLSSGQAAAGSVGSGGGLAVPASGVPVSSGEDPAVPAGGTSGPGGGTPANLPTPQAGSLPPVAALRTAETPDAVLLSASSLTADQVAQVGHLKGIVAVMPVDTGTVTMSGAPVVTFGVDPAQFRNFAPPASAASDKLWQYVAAGSLVASYDMARDRGLKLGSQADLVPAGASRNPVSGWIGAFASIGLPGVDLLVSHAYSGDLGLTPGSGLIVSAPKLDAAQLQSELTSVLPGAAVEPLHADQIPLTVPGNTVSSTTRQQIISAALSRVGRPYVWGGAGPDNFDCSGLVQWSYRQAGILMPRVAAEQFLTGNHIPLADALPGDLLFWTYDPTDPGYVDHTAIYLGNGMMVVAPHTGLNVQVVPVPTEDFAGAVEVVLRSS